MTATKSLSIKPLSLQKNGRNKSSGPRSTVVCSMTFRWIPERFPGGFRCVLHTQRSKVSNLFLLCPLYMNTINFPPLKTTE